MTTKMLMLDLVTARALESRKDPRTTYDKVFRRIRSALVRLEGSLLNRQREPNENNLYNVAIDGSIVATFEIKL